jgi:hypothetical protein
MGSDPAEQGVRTTPPDITRTAGAYVRATQYPLPLVFGLGASGVVAFLLVGFVGYSGHRSWLDTIFREPWPLFIWFCCLALVFYVIMLRPSPESGWLANVLGVMLATILSVVAVAYLHINLAGVVFVRLELLHYLGESKWTYTNLNFILLGTFWADTLWRWARRAQGKSPTIHVEIDRTSGKIKQVEATTDMPSMQELIAGDLIAGTVLALVLALIFRPEVVNALSNVGVGIHINTCTVSWPVGACVHGGALSDPPTLFFIDLIQALVSAFFAAILTAILLLRLDPMALQRIIQEAARTLQLITLGKIVRWTLWQLRHVLWPEFVVATVLGAAWAAEYTARYLHLQASQQASDASGALMQGLFYLGMAAVSGSCAVLFLVLSAALLLFKGEVIRGAIVFLRTTVPTFAHALLLALGGFNALLWATGVSAQTPFFQPTASAIIALLGALGLLIIRLARQWLQSDAQAKSNALSDRLPFAQDIDEPGSGTSR